MKVSILYRLYVVMIYKIARLYLIYYPQQSKCSLSETSKNVANLLFLLFSFLITSESTEIQIYFKIQYDMFIKLI